MVLPVVLIFFAALAAAALAYGTDPGWAQFHHGIDFILWSRRLQWPLIAVTLILCLALLVLIISGKRRAWWLLALSPILALFVHRFATDPTRDALVVEDPQFADGSTASFLHPGDYVVGIRLGDSAYAFPYSILFHAPAIIFSNRQQRVILLWSPFANRALAFSINHDLSARDLEVVSSPANSNLLYHSKDGQFINAITGRTPHGQPVVELREQLELAKVTWSTWVQDHPDTQVMTPFDNHWQTAPAEPILPRFPLPKSSSESTTHRRACVISTTQPIALAAESIASAPLNLTTGKTPVLVMRDALGQLHAFDRHVDEDLSPRFFASSDPKHPTAVMTDIDTNTEWSITGVAVEGPKETHGKKLQPLPIENDLYFDVMKYWYPDLQWIDEAALASAIQPSPSPAPAQKPVPIKRRRATHQPG